MKVLVLGATGMAGHTLSIYLKEAGYNVTAFSRSGFKYGPNIVGDVTDFDQLKTIIHNGNFDVIINSIGLLNQEADIHKSSAVLLNSYLPHFLSDITRESQTRIIHMSTDCVFSGKTGNYVETSFKDGDTFYDRSKALGELDNDKDLTFRNSIIGPDLKKEGIGLFNWFMKQTGHVKGFTQAIWSGVTTLTLAKAMKQAIEENLTGLYHLVNNQSINKNELLKLFNRHLRNGDIDIIEDKQLSVNKSLISTRTDFSFNVPSYEEMIIEMKEWIYAHKELYPHYFV